MTNELDPIVNYILSTVSPSTIQFIIFITIVGFIPVLLLSYERKRINKIGQRIAFSIVGGLIYFLAILSLTSLIYLSIKPTENWSLADYTFYLPIASIFMSYVITYIVWEFLGRTK